MKDDRAECMEPVIRGHFNKTHTLCFGKMSPNPIQSQRNVPDPLKTYFTNKQKTPPV